MGLPLTRELTATPGSPVPSNAFNKVEDCIIGDKHGAIVIWQPVIAPKATSWTWDGNAAIAGAAPASFAGPLYGYGVGTTITSVTARILLIAAAGGILEIDIVLHKDDGTTATLATVTVNNSVNGWQDINVPLQAPYVAGHIMAAGETLTVAGLANGTGGVGVGAIGLGVQRT